MRKGKGSVFSVAISDFDSVICNCDRDVSLFVVFNKRRCNLKISFFYANLIECLVVLVFLVVIF